MRLDFAALDRYHISLSIWVIGRYTVEICCSSYKVMYQEFVLACKRYIGHCRKLTGCVSAEVYMFCLMALYCFSYRCLHLE